MWVGGCPCVCVYECVSVSVCVGVCVGVWVYVWVGGCPCVCVYECVFVSVCVGVCGWMGGWNVSTCLKPHLSLVNPRMSYLSCVAKIQLLNIWSAVRQLPLFCDC